jgi:hypothetical protein
MIRKSINLPGSSKKEVISVNIPIQQKEKPREAKMI